MARYPSRSYTHKYGDLTVTVKYVDGAYVAHVLRPSDGYEVSIETFGQMTPMDAARYALGRLANGGRSDDPVLLRASKELGHDAAEALVGLEESPELSGPYNEGRRPVTPYKPAWLRPRLSQSAMVAKKDEWFALIPSSVGPLRAAGLTAVAALAAEGGHALFPNSRLTLASISNMTSVNVGQLRSDIWVDFGFATALSGVIGLITGMVLPAVGSEAVGVYHLVSRLMKITEVEKRGTI